MKKKGLVHWVDVTGGLVVVFSLKICGLHSVNMHACVWPNDFAHYWIHTAKIVPAYRYGKSNIYSYALVQIMCATLS